MLLDLNMTNYPIAQERDLAGPLFRPPLDQNVQPALTSRELIRQYLLENFLFTSDPTAIEDDASFLEMGIIDSMGALEIALFLEQTFGFAVGEDQMLPDNLDSVNRLVAFVERNLARA